jgi:hypothetical protein
VNRAVLLTHLGEGVWCIAQDIQCCMLWGGWFWRPFDLVHAPAHGRVWRMGKEGAGV